MNLVMPCGDLSGLDVREIEKDDDGNGDTLLDRVAVRAATLCEAPIGLVTSLEGGRQRFVGRWGTRLTGTARRDSFCAHAVLFTDPMVVEDAAADARFADTILVAGSPFVRFYAGVPIFDEQGLPLGSVCALDTVARTVGASALHRLQRLARMTGVALSARRAMRGALGPCLDAVDVEATLARLDLTLAPLFDEGNGLGAPAPLGFGYGG